MKFEQKTVLITGANRGIGRALVDEALARGAGKVYAGTRVPFQHPDARVSPLTLDVRDAGQIQRGASQLDRLDLLINNAGLQIYDDLGDSHVIQQLLDVNLFGILNVTRAFLPLLVRSRGAIANNLSLVALASLPVVSGYSLSKAAAANMTQSLRASLSSRGVSVHAIFTGPTDTDMNRGFNIPKVSTAVTARGIFDGLARGDEDIFPDPLAEQFAEGWRQGVAKNMERQFAAMVPAGSVSVT
jgi:NAD(P)-dependent dehydrogenase (short-subunit alcohol dehydrogenase family)